MREMTIKKLTVINAITQYYTVATQLFINIILARLITPAEFGILSMVNVFIVFFSLFSDMGFGIAYIQRKDMTESERNNIFSFMAYLGIGLYVFFLVFSRFISWFYGDKVYIELSKSLGLVLFLSAINVIPYSDLVKKQRFILVNVVKAFATTISSMVAVALAYKGFSYYSLVIRSIMCSLLTFVVYLCATRTKFVLKADFSVVRKLWNFSLGQLIFNIINYLSRNLDNLLIGKFFGKEQLGYYDKAYSTTTNVMTNTSSIISSSIQPILAKYQDDKELVFEHFEKTFMFLVIVGAWAGLVCSSCADEIIYFMFGTQWKDSVEPFYYLAISLCVQVPLSCTGAFFQVLNNTKLLAKAGIISAVVLCAGIVIGIYGGTIGKVALCYCVAQAVNLFIMLVLFEKRLFSISFKTIYSGVVKTFFSFVIVHMSAIYLFETIEVRDDLLRILLKTIFSSFLFLLLTFVLNNGKYLTNVVMKNKDE